jgi:hypothetical protein
MLKSVTVPKVASLVVSTTQEFQRRRTVCSRRREQRRHHNGFISRRTAGRSAMHAAEIAHGREREKTCISGRTLEGHFFFDSQKNADNKVLKALGLLSNWRQEGSRHKGALAHLALWFASEHSHATPSTHSCRQRRQKGNCVANYHSA